VLEKKTIIAINLIDLDKQRFSIIDIETTGGLAKRDKITEIAIIVYENGQIVDSFESLINPERSIPYEITRITGISNEMVESSPKFYEIAKEILQKTEGCIFVAHNVFFDYNFIREEFHQLGYNFSRKKLCTVQLSRRHFKGLRSYSLGSLIEHFNISVAGRHRAMEDTKATLEVFIKILKLNDETNLSLTDLSAILKENKIPPNINKSEIEALPERPGVYYMRDRYGVPIYIGKSKSIKDRIFQHFNDTSSKTRKMLELVHELDCIETGNELMASLMEAREIKIHQPEINRALRRKTHASLLTSQKRDAHFSQFTIKEAEWLDSSDEILNHYSTHAAAKEYLEYLIYTYNLCKKVNDGVLDGAPCYSYQLAQCHGACIGKEDTLSYNERFDLAYHEVNKVFKESFYLIGEGRTFEEKSIVIVENGFCSYIGFLHRDENFTSVEDMKEQLEAYKGNVESNRIIEYYLSRSRDYKKVMLINKYTRTSLFDN
jgi:DNA polymerase-3 subunit epsilon